jgi:aryl-alcohol dehydrogenase-like predicted oxidoreductase
MSLPSDTPLPFTRRDFLKSTLAAGLASSLGSTARAAEAELRNGIPYRALGSTGEKVSHVGLGGWHIGSQFAESDSIAIIRTALDGGINFLDNSWDYNGGASEVRMGKALRDGYRDKAFLMTKIDGREKTAAARQIDQSLQRLQVSHVDLMQFHEIIRITDPDRIFAPGGAMEAMMDAKKAGKVRYIGFTGHKSPEIHLKMLATAAAHQFRFDTVQMPLNVMDAHFDSFGAKVLPELNKSGIGALGMKSLGCGMILQSKTVSPVECLHYAMNLPVSVVITGCDSLDILNQAIGAAQSFKPLSAQEVADILAKTAPVAQSGQYELYKTSTDFDGTVHNPQFLG